MDDGGFQALTGLNDIPEGDFFVAVTRMDMIGIKGVASRIKSDKKGPPKAKGKKIRMTSLQILDFIEKDLKGKGNLPKHAQFFFVASCGASMDDLQELAPDVRWNFFCDKEVRENFLLPSDHS